MFLMEFMHAYRCFPIRWFQLQMIMYMNSFDHKSIVTNSHCSLGF